MRLQTRGNRRQETFVITIIIIKIPLFTLGSIYSTNASGSEQLPETNNLLAEGKPAGYLQTWPRILTREQIQLAVRAGLELGTSELQVQRSNRSAMLPPMSE